MQRHFGIAPSSGVPRFETVARLHSLMYAISRRATLPYYNRGNNKRRIFFNPDNYIYFLRKVRKYILPLCDILNYCLMPTHFHFVISADKRTIEIKRVGNQERNVLSEGIRNLLSSYAQGINNQKSTTGSLFQQNTKAKCLSDGSINYGPTCFHYVHQNAWKCGLVKRMEDWEYSSFRDYAGLRNGTLCNKELAYQLLDLDPNTFYRDSYGVIDPDRLNGIF